VPAKPVVRPDPTRWNFSADEEALAADAAGSLHCLDIARLSAATLADALWQMPAPPRPKEPTGGFYRKVALLQLGALTVRSTRALAVLVTHGYEAEAHGLKRRLSEVFNRAQVVTADTTGEQARRWLHNEDAGTHGRIAQKVGTHEEWRYFSIGSHAESAGVKFVTSPPGWDLALPDEPLIQLKPDRFPRHANGLLYDAAYQAAGMLGALAEVFGVTVEIPAPLHDGLHAARRRLEATQGPSDAT
jgi:hypothetical protein